MEQLHNGFTLALCDDAFPLSTDSIALADFIKLPKNASVLDLGSGCGTLGLLLCASHTDCCVTGIELNNNAHRTALRNAQDNHIDFRLKSICDDVRNVPSLVTAGSFSCCVSNPPYFSSGPASKSHATARRDDLCSMQSLFEAAAWALKYGGDFFLVHRPERLAELFACAVNSTLEPKRICLFRHRPDDPVALVLVQCRKGAKTGLIWQDVCLYDRDGAQTSYYKKIYHI